MNDNIDDVLRSMKWKYYVQHITDKPPDYDDTIELFNTIICANIGIHNFSQYIRLILDHKSSEKHMVLSVVAKHMYKGLYGKILMLLDKETYNDIKKVIKL